MNFIVAVAESKAGRRLTFHKCTLDSHCSKTRHDSSSTTPSHARKNNKKNAKKLIATMSDSESDAERGENESGKDSAKNKRALGTMWPLLLFGALVTLMFIGFGYSFLLLARVAQIAWKCTWILPVELLWLLMATAMAYAFFALGWVGLLLLKQQAM